MLDSLLIANRGEIARRIIRTARRLGVRTVAVYSEADAGLPYIREADEAVCLGPAAAKDSYLNQDRVLAAAKAAGVQAIHPGYGFLSENAGFAERVKAEGLVWVGAPPAAIRAMGLKDAAKKLMAGAGVPVTPGYWGADQSPGLLKREAEKIGYPVLIKAVAGGGGKGMRRVENATEFDAALASCQREAAASFSDDRVMIEKYVSRPRHIEVQVFGDTQGNVVHLFERDCSLQRRHQKVIEEAPAPGMDPKTREALCAAAVRAAKAVSYEGAGTVEFIADASDGLRADRIWFMEMNTRLQVEHPVTEMITGLDLVEWQLRVAAGEPLPLSQDRIVMTGHAMEARLYAENTAAGFLPSTGALSHFVMPEDARVDTGVEQGCEITAFYDPMIAKIVTHAPSRTGAAQKLAAACAKVQVYPVKTNAGFLVRALAHPDFRAGHVDTGFIAARHEALVPTPAPSEAALRSAAVARLNAHNQGKASPWSALCGFRLNEAPAVEVPLQHHDQCRTVTLDPPNRAHDLPVFTAGEEVVVFERGEAFVFTPPRIAAAVGSGAAGSGVLLAPMPGHILAVAVKAGDRVKKGQHIVTLEAMKMEHAMTAPFDGIVAEVKAKAGEKVSEGALLARLDNDAEADKAQDA